MAVLNGWQLFAQRQASRSLTQVGNPSARMHWAQLPPLWFNRNRVQPWVLGRMQSFRLVTTEPSFRFILAEPNRNQSTSSSSDGTTTLTPGKKPLITKHHVKQRIDDNIRPFRLVTVKRAKPRPPYSSSSGTTSLTKAKKSIVRDHWAQESPTSSPVRRSTSLTKAEDSIVRNHWSDQRPSDRMPRFRPFMTETTKNGPTYSSFDGTTLPSYISQVQFPASDVAGYKAPRGGPQCKRTEEDLRNVRAVLKTPIKLVALYVTPRMIDAIKESPYFDSDDNEIVIFSHRHRTRGRNVQHCYKILSRLIRNVSCEISYRRQRIAADEVMYRGEVLAPDRE